MIKPAALYLFLLLAVCSCKSMRKVFQSETVRDTVTISKDSTFILPGDTVHVRIPCDTDTVYIVRSKTASALIQVKNRRANVTGICDEQAKTITALLKQINTRNIERVTETIYKVPAWCKWSLLISGLELFVIILLAKLR